MGGIYDILIGEDGPLSANAALPFDLGSYEPFFPYANNQLKGIVIANQQTFLCLRAGEGLCFQVVGTSIPFS